KAVPAWDWALTVHSMRTKLPLGARPGPLLGRLASLSASMRTPVMLARLVRAVIVYVSGSGWAPDASTDPSGLIVSVAPPEATADVGGSAPQLLPLWPPLARPSAKLARLSVVTYSLNLPRLCPV